MRLSRWGWSPYETQEDARLERRCLAPLVTIVPDSADAEIVVVHSKINVGEEEIRRAPSLRLVITTAPNRVLHEQRTTGCLPIACGSSPSDETCPYKESDGSL